MYFYGICQLYLQHSRHKHVRKVKRSSINPLYTMSSNDERLQVYNATSNLIATPIERKIVKISDSDIVAGYIEKHNITGEIYTCSYLSVFGTDYQKDQVVILPESDNNRMEFGKIIELLSCQENAYVMYKKMSSIYCPMSDLYFLEELEAIDLIPTHQLACFRPLETYEVGESRRIAVSLRSYVLA